MHPLSSVAFFETSEKSARNRGMCVNAYARKFTGVRSTRDAIYIYIYIKYILNLYSRHERLTAQPTASSRRNTKFPYSDAPRQKLTLLRFIDPQYCVPPRAERPRVLVLRPRSYVHQVRTPAYCMNAYTQYSAHVYIWAPSPLAVVFVFSEVQGFEFTEYGYFYSVNVEYRDYRY